MAVKEVLPVKPYPASENRHLHVFRKVAPTPPEFPRRAGMARKRPLRVGVAVTYAAHSRTKRPSPHSFTAAVRLV